MRVKIVDLLLQAYNRKMGRNIWRPCTWKEILQR